MRALVTGATGFLGSHLVRRLRKEGANVAVLLRAGSSHRRLASMLDDLEVIPGDLSSIPQSAEPIRRFGPDTVFHLAWYGASSFRYQDDPAQVFDNLGGSLELVRVSADAGCRCWIGMGSVLECGTYAIPHPENVKVTPKSLYGAAKYSTGLIGEHLCRIYGMRSIWFRLFWAYGPDDDPARMIPYLITTLLKKQRPSLTPGAQRWDYVYIDDVVEALFQVAVNASAQGTFNLGSGEAHTIRDVAIHIRDAIDSALPLGFGDLSYRPDQIMHLQADISRLRDEIGWSPTVALTDGLMRTMEWYRDR
jgi:UDP-glucose 4-epimerase